MKTDQRLAYGIREACTATGLGRSILYQLIADGDLKTFKIGSRRLIAEDDLIAFIERHRKVEA